MATEIRRILFDDGELQDMVAAYINSPASRFEPGTVMDYQLVKDDPLHATVFVQASSGQQANLRFDNLELMAAALHHLMSRKVPIARKADKTLKRGNNGHIVLDMVTGAL